MNKTLNEYLNKLINENPFYRDFYKNIHISDYENFDDYYNALPILTKEIIMDNLRDIVSKDFYPSMDKNKLYELFSNTDSLSQNHSRELINNGNKWILETTTGTTGLPFCIVKTPYEKLVEQKHLFQLRKQHLSTVSIQNGLLLLEPIDNYICSLNYRGTNCSDIEKIFDRLLELRPEWLLTTTLILRNLYDYINATNKFDRLKCLHLSFIETTSQKLLDYELDSISAAFNTKIVNQYGCRELWNLGYDCEYGNMHLNNKYLKIDLINSERKIINRTDCEGEVIATSLLHKTFPLVKYYIGDLAEYPNETCQCNNSGKIIKLKIGRKKQKIYNSELYGNEIFRKVLRFMNFHTKYNIKHIKIIQNEPFSFDVFTEKVDDEKEFIRIFKTSVTTVHKYLKNYNFNFQFYYPFFDQEKDILKHEIFECNMV